MSAEGPPRGAGPLGGTARSADRGDHTTLSFPAIRFDGRTALAQDVEVRVEGATLAVIARGSIALERVRIDPSRVSEFFVNAPRIIALDRGVSLEVPDADGRFDRALNAAGVTPTGVQRMQQLWPASLAALAGLIGIVAFIYVHGVPAAAHWLALRLPAGLEQRIGDEVLVQLDKHTMQPTELPLEQQIQIRRKFAAAAALAAPDVAYRLEFRSAGGKFGINAMALPGGTIVLLDGLVELAGNDDAVIGVAGHELGHVAGKHSLRQLLQSLGVGALAAVLWGDFSTVIANVPIAFGILRYGRDFEREADEFAIALLSASGTPRQPLIDFFDQVDRMAQMAGRSAPPAFLSSHPATEERKQRLRDGGK